MAAIEAGRVCIKKKGRETGKKCVIISIEKNFAVVQGEKVRKRKCNIMHLIPLDKKIELGKETTQEEIIKELKKIKV